MNKATSLLSTDVDALPETHETEWYKRLVETAELATQAELVQSGVLTRQ